MKNVDLINVLSRFPGASAVDASLEPHAAGGYVIALEVTDTRDAARVGRVEFVVQPEAEPEPAQGSSEAAEDGGASSAPPAG